MMSSISRIKEQKQTIIRQYIQADNAKASTQVLTTLVSLLLIWLGMWIVRDSIKMAAEERERKARKRAKAEMM